METSTSTKVAAVTTALFMASLFWLVNIRSGASSLEEGLKDQKLKSEALLSEKLLLERDVEKYKDQLFKLRDHNSELDGVVKNTTAKMNRQEAAYERLKSQNTSVVQLKRQRQELQALVHQLENELASQRYTYAAIEAKNVELSNTIASLEERNRMLVEDLERSMFMSVDLSQIQALKGKSGKLTVNARRTKKLVASFEVPASLKSLSFRITNGDGKTLTTEQGSISARSLPADHSLTAASHTEAQAGKLQNVEVVYTSREKLKAGVYMVEILNENLYVGSLKVKLR